MSAGKSARLSIREIAELSLFCALMVAGKECLRLIPNVHPVTLLLLLLATAVYGAKALYPAFGFALLEIALYGAGLWNLMYLYVWPIVVLAALPFRRSESRAFWTAIAGLHGLCFGAHWSARRKRRAEENSKSTCLRLCARKTVILKNCYFTASVEQDWETNEHTAFSFG